MDREVKDPDWRDVCGGSHHPAADGGGPLPDAVSPADAMSSPPGDVKTVILALLAVRELDTSTLSKAMRLHVTTVRYHLRILERQGLVERAPSVRGSRVGRPSTRYRLTSEPIPGDSAPFDSRKIYEDILRALGRDLDGNDLHAAMYRAARESGRQFAQSLGVRGGEPWGPKEFSDALLRARGLRTQGVLVTEQEVRFAVVTCPLLSLARELPERACGQLEAGFHEGVADALHPGVTIRQVGCVGRGDRHCEFMYTWPREGAVPQANCED